MRQAERGKQRWGASRPDGKADGGRRSAGRQPVTPASVLSGTACPQHPELTFNPRRSAGDAVRDARQPDPETMRRLHVQPEWLTRRPMQLSGGELARIAILRALDPRTRFLIADEMTAQLDPSIQKAIWVYVLEVCRSRSLGMLVISHQSALLDQVCTRHLQVE